MVIMPNLKLTSNQARMLALRAECGFNDAEALARSFSDGALSGGPTAMDRLRVVLAATERSVIPGLHTALAFRDAGFWGDPRPGGPGLRDPWPKTGSVNQVGHFLTAVRLGFQPELVSRPLLGPSMRFWIGAAHALSDEQVALRLTIGHELARDPGLWKGAGCGGLFAGILAWPVTDRLGPSGQLGAVALAGCLGMVAGAALEHLLGFRRQFGRAGQPEELAFLRAAVALGEGPSMDLDAAERELRPILDRIDVTQSGNSYQDLRLSLLGWWLGQAIRQGRFEDRHEVANWLRLNLQRG